MGTLSVKQRINTLYHRLQSTCVEVISLKPITNVSPSLTDRHKIISAVKHYLQTYNIFHPHRLINKGRGDRNSLSHLRIVLNKYRLHWAELYRIQNYSVALFRWFVYNSEGKYRNYGQNFIYCLKNGPNVSLHRFTKRITTQLHLRAKLKI